MKLARSTAWVLAFFMLVGCLKTHVFAIEGGTDSIPITDTVNSCNTLDATTTYLGAKNVTDNIGSAIVYEINSDTLMYTIDADKRVFPSSLTKILTALIAVEKGNTDDIVKVSQEVLDTVPYYAASAELVADEEIKLSDLLYCMMVGSANDAAAVIANHISGSQEKFVQEMNAYAAKLGCVDTQFVNVHGLHDEQQYSTTRDLAKILAAAVKNEAFLPFFSAVHYDVPATNKSELRDLASGNFLMNTDNMQIYYDDRVKGGRTGVTDDGLHCLATMAEQGNMKLIAIVTGSKSTLAEDGRTLAYGSFKETSSLLDAAFSGYHVVQILYENQALKQIEVHNGENDVILGALESSYAVLPESVMISDLSYRFTDNVTSLSAPISLGQVLSNVEIWYASLCIGKSDLVAMNTVRVKMQQQTDDVDEDTGEANVSTIVILSVLCVALVVLLIRYSGKLKSLIMKKRTNAYRNDRRRSR